MMNSSSGTACSFVTSGSLSTNLQFSYVNHNMINDQVDWAHTYRISLQGLMLHTTDGLRAFYFSDAYDKCLDEIWPGRRGLARLGKFQIKYLSSHL